MSNKSGIRVDPRTFKIINNSKLESPTITSDPELSSESDSLTSVNSHSNTVKVIKLDNQQHTGGFANPQVQKSQLDQQKQIQILPQPPQKQPQFQQQSQKLQPQAQAQPQPQPQPQAQAQPPQQESQKQTVQQSNNNNLESYLKNSIQNDENNENTNTNTDTNDNEETVSVPETESVVESDAAIDTASEKSTTEGQQTQDVFDLTQNKLYQVLSAFFEDSTGNNLCQNMVKFTELFEKQNQIMEKILNQLVIISSNYNKQIKIPESLQTNTRPAGSIIDFRKKIEEIKHKKN